MQEVELRKEEEYIKLVQAFKKAGLVSEGSDAAYEIKNSKVKVNGETELRRGRKLFDGDTFSYGGKDYMIKGN